MLITDKKSGGGTGVESDVKFGLLLPLRKAAFPLSSGIAIRRDA